MLLNGARCFQADRLCEDAHRVASDQCMWVSSELKRARSLVRIAEIQSTLHEQRCVLVRSLGRNILKIAVVGLTIRRWV